jgi:hypothetical protein
MHCLNHKQRFFDFVKKPKSKNYNTPQAFFTPAAAARCYGICGKVQ